MPIYEYRCIKCGLTNEIWNDQEAKCLNCDSPDLQKLISAPNLNKGASQKNAEQTDVSCSDNCDQDSCQLNPDNFPDHIDNVPATIHLPTGDVKVIGRLEKVKEEKKESEKKKKKN